MKVETKYDLDRKVETSQGPGRIEMIGLTDEGTKYLVVLKGDQGKLWLTEAQLEQANEKRPSATVSAVKETKVASLIAALLVFGWSLTLPLCAQVSGYETRQDTSTSTNWAEVAFAGQGAVQNILTSLELQSESTTNTLNIFAGTTPYPVWYSLNSTQLVVGSNIGVPTTQFALLSLPASNALFVVHLASTNQLTNVFVGGPGPVRATGLNTTYLGGITNTNALLWVCTNQSISWPGLGRITLDGQLFSGKIGAPLGIRWGSQTGPVGGASNQIRRAVVQRFYPSPGLVQ